MKTKEWKTIAIIFIVLFVMGSVLLFLIVQSNTQNDRELERIYDLYMKEGRCKEFCKYEDSLGYEYSSTTDECYCYVLNEKKMEVELVKYEFE